MEILTLEDKHEIENEVEKRVDELEKSSGWTGITSWARGVLKTIPGKEAVAKDFRKYSLNCHPDKWKKTCGIGTCGSKPGGRDWQFCTERCKNSYCELVKKWREGELAYQILTDGNKSGPDQGNEKENCDYCENIFNWASRYPQCKAFRKSFNREENFWFCSLHCYNDFFICSVCDKRTRPGVNYKKGSGWILKGYLLKKSKYAFCSPDCKQNFQDWGEGYNQEKCFHCGKDFWQRDILGSMFSFFLPEDKSKRFCSDECIKKWREIHNIELRRAESILAIDRELKIKPEVKTSDLEPSNQNWTEALQNAIKREEIQSIEATVKADIQKKRASKSGKEVILSLLEQCRNTNDFEELYSLIKQLKEFQLTKDYQEHWTKIKEQVARLKNLNPQEYNKRVKSSFEEQIESHGLTYEEVSDETKTAMKEAEDTGEPEKIRIAEELIETDSSLKSLNQLLVQVSQAQTKSEKQKLLKELLVFIEASEKAYKRKKSEVDEVVNKLTREVRTEPTSPEDFPYLPIFLVLMAVLVIGVSLFLFWKKPRKY
jgi:hypothetical protein